VAARLSISTRLALWYGLSLLLLLGLVAGFLYAGFHLTLHRDFDAALTQEADRVVAALPPAASPDVPEAFVRASEASPYAIHLLTPSGRVRYGNGRLPAVVPHVPGTGRRAVYHEHVDPEPSRTRYEPVPDAQGRTAAWVAVTATESGVHREMHRLGWLLALAVFLGTAVAAASGYGLARRALRPVAALTRAANGIGPAERGARLPTEPGPADELGDLAGAFNALLARLDGAFERERRFRADAAHELLTPVTAARSEIDVALRRDREPEGYRDALTALGRHVDRMGGLVADLLVLSRAETGPVASGGTVDLGALAERLGERSAPVAEAKGIALVQDVAPGVVVVADAADVEVILENLLDNAIKYTPAGGTVTLTVRSDGGDGTVLVADTGVGFGDGERERLFERFYRADTPQVQAEPGSGLGLAIAQRLAERHEGQIAAESPGRGLGSTFVLRLPGGLRSSPSTGSADDPEPTGARPPAT
jgi:signal transduction histidine kinase